MTRPETGLAEIISRSRHILLDFDGPVCTVFARTPASTVAERLRNALETAGITLPPHVQAEDDPMEVFRIAARLGHGEAERAQRELTRLETLAVNTARPTPGAADLIAVAHQAERTVTIVSNNSGHAISRYLASRHIPAHITAIIGRDDPDPARMKPSPYRVHEAIGALGASPRECAFIGDSPSDVLAGHLAGVTVIGYANTPGKADQLTQAGADAVTTDLAEITTALRAQTESGLA
jgi:HAD superfamily hydrolase (TIGR01509 family)